MVEPSTTNPEPQWIGLALSGGGFRATLFHLGVIQLLRECGLLPRVKLICSVSGGSILAVHLALNWDKYVGGDEDFNAAADSIINFTKIDVRNRIIRRWLSGTLFVLPRLFGKFRFVTLLQQHYDILYGKATFENLRAFQDRPEIHILATSLTTGSLCKFTNRKFDISDARYPCSVDISFPRLSFAVAASSAFPLFFPPVQIDNKILQCNQPELPHPHFLTDGGVFDNLGLQELSKVAKDRNQDGGLLIASDASANFDWAVGKKYRFLFFRNLRANDIMMHRLNKLVLGITENRCPHLCKIEIGHELSPEEEPTALPRELQTGACNIRTDLNSFSDIEIRTLIRHGYSEARAMLRNAGIYPPSPGPSGPMGDQAPGSATKLEIEDARRRGWIKLFAPGDMATWVVLCGVLLWGIFLCITPPFLIAHFRYQRSIHEHEVVESKLQQTVSLYEEANAQLQGDMPTRLYVIKVVDPSNFPVANANITVTVEGIPPQKGYTDSKGFYRFSWKPTGESVQAHLWVEASGFWTLDDSFSLSEEPVHLIYLNKGD